MNVLKQKWVTDRFDNEFSLIERLFSTVRKYRCSLMLVNQTTVTDKQVRIGALFTQRLQNFTDCQRFTKKALNSDPSSPFLGPQQASYHQFLEKLTDATLEEDEAMVTFDVTALFASIDLDLANKISKELPQEHYPD